MKLLARLIQALTFDILDAFDRQLCRLSNLIGGDE